MAESLSFLNFVTIGCYMIKTNFFFLHRNYSSDEEFLKVVDKIKIGDIIGCTGSPGKT